jgi:hypothetical protein
MEHKNTAAYQDDDCYRHDDTNTPCYNSLCSHYTLILDKNNLLNSVAKVHFLNETTKYLRYFFTKEEISHSPILPHPSALIPHPSSF